MKSDFVIVIRVDHMRARIAYERGYNDMCAIWPRIESFAARADAQASAEIAAIYAWMEKPVTHRGPPPTFATKPIAKLDPGGAPIRNYYTKKYNDELSGARHMLEMACLATAPFEITEHQAEVMLGYQRGTRIEEILQEIGEVSV